jgi:hypothetical protein
VKGTTRRFALRADTVRRLSALELGRAAGGRLATSEAIDGWPCPGEYSWVCKP